MKRDKRNRRRCKFYKPKTNGCMILGPRGHQGCHCNGYYINSRGQYACRKGKGEDKDDIQVSI